MVYGLQSSGFLPSRFLYKHFSQNWVEKQNVQSLEGDSHCQNLVEAETNGPIS